MPKEPSLWRLKERMLNMKALKKIVCTILILVFMCNITVFASATNLTASKSTEVLLVNGVEYTRTTEIVNENTIDEYTVISVESANEISVFDTRFNYILYNGEKIHFTIGEDVLARATKPTTIDHGYVDQIASHWVYSYSNWVEYKLDQALGNVTMAVWLTMMGPWALPLELINILADYFDKTDEQANAFWIRRYYYGNTYVVSDFATVSQSYTNDYTPIPDTDSADSRLFR